MTETIYTPDDALQEAMGELTDVVILGYDAQGKFRFLSDGGKSFERDLALIELARAVLIRETLGEGAAIHDKPRH